MKRDDLPPPMPPQHQHGDEATLLHHSVAPDGQSDVDDIFADLPDGPPDDAEPYLQSGTGAKVAMPAQDDAHPTQESTHERLVRHQHNAERRVPVSPRQRPTLMPNGFEAPPRLPSARREPDPALVRPVRPAEGGGKHMVGEKRESSDVIQMFPATSPQPAPMYQKSRTAPPPPQPPQGRLIRRGPQTQPPPSAPNTSQPPTATRAALPAAPSVLPLQAERMAALISDQRARLRTLDVYARTLEIGAGLFGTVSLAVLIASLVSILLGNGQSLVVAGTAVVSSLAGLALTALMVAAAAGLRQVADNTAQIGALLEALSQPPR